MKRRKIDQKHREASEAGKGPDKPAKPTGLLGLFARSSEVPDEQPASAAELPADAKARYGRLAPMFEELLRTSPNPSTTAVVPVDTFYGQYLDLFMPATQATATETGTSAPANTGTAAAAVLEVARKRDREAVIAMDAEEFVARFAGVLVEPVGDAAKTVH